MCVRTSTAFYGSFILAMGRSPGFGSAHADLRPIKTRFPFGSGLYVLNLPAPATRRTVLQKVRGSAFSHCGPAACKHRVSGSLSLPSRGPFHLSFTVLCSIGHWVVFSLGGWSPLLPARFLVSRRTPDSAGRLGISPTGLSPSPAGFPKTVRLSFLFRCAVHTPRCTHRGLGSSPFARRY